MKFNVDGEENNFIGLIAGLQEKAKLEVTSFEVVTLKTMDVSCSNAPKFDSELSTKGIGAFVGAKIKADLFVSHKAFPLEINVLGVPNVGGFIGYGIVPSKRGKGYGNEMLRLLAPRAPAARPVVTGAPPIARSRCRGDPRELCF